MILLIIIEHKNCLEFYFYNSFRFETLYANQITHT